MEDSAARAVVLWSLFEERIEHHARELDYDLQHGAERFAESVTYFPQVEDYNVGPHEYLDHIAKATDAVDIPIITSLNGISTGGWGSGARKMARAGAHAIELNVYYIPTDPTLTAEKVEDVYVSVLRAVEESVSIPVAVKLPPYFSSTANMMTPASTRPGRTWL